MKQKAAKILDVAIHSINLLLINYALSNMMALFRSSVLYILFFTSEMWVFAQSVSYTHLTLPTNREV